MNTICVVSEPIFTHLACFRWTLGALHVCRATMVGAERPVTIGCAPNNETFVLA